VVSALAGSLLSAASASASPPPPVPTPSAIGDEAVFWIAVSPAYQSTGTVVAASAQLHHCSSNCTHLWVTRDRGANWTRQTAVGWKPGRPVVAVDRHRREVLFSSSSSVERSDDGGAIWVAVGGAGSATPAPTYASDGAVAVAGPRDYLLRDGPTEDVAGSGGRLVDRMFTYAPTFPSGGSHAAALLSAADPQSGVPVIQQCSPYLACSGSSRLPGAGHSAMPVSLLLSGGYSHDGVVFAQTERDVYKSVDGGVSFSPLPVPGADGTASSSIPMTALATGYSEGGPVRTVFAAELRVVGSGPAAHTAGGVYRSLDGGATWGRIGLSTPLDGGATAVAVAPDGRLFAGYFSSGRTGLLCSTDGSTWKASCSSTQPTARAAESLTSRPGATECRPAHCSGGASAGDAIAGKDAGLASSAARDPIDSRRASTSEGGPSRVRPVVLAICGAFGSLVGAGVFLGRRRRGATAGA
jgi:photosystem II stability/assembly factor-like uncharacterized protein